MHILSHRNINLHSASTDGGLIHIAQGTSKSVPDDVADHPGFAMLLKAGHIVKIAPAEPAAESDADKTPKRPTGKESK